MGKPRVKKELSERIVSVVESLVHKYYFRFDMYGWATFVVDGHHGDLLINSDWGKWCHTWGGGPKSWGSPTFIEFLKSTNPDYLANKLGYDTETEEIDAEATRRKMKQHIINRRLEGVCFEVDDFPKPTAKEATRLLWQDMMEFCDALAEDQHFAQYCLVSDALGKEFECMSEWIEHRYTGRHVFLTEQLLPTFLGYLRGDFDGKTKPGETN
jgi:hypothetical protein